MAYDFLPTTADQIRDKIKDKEMSTVLSRLLIDLQHNYPSIPDPLAIDPGMPKQPKLTRMLSTKEDLRKLNSMYKPLTIKFGNGSRGNRGTGNRGLLFERELSDDINRWIAGEEVKSQINKKIIDDLINEYQIDKWPEIFVDEEGAENKPRPLVFSGSKILISPGLVDIGAVVTDITLRKGSNKSAPAGAYLSLKYSALVAFFNAGVRKYLRDSEIEKGMIKDSNGLKLLDMFGIDNALFCSVFNGRGKEFKSYDVTKSVNKSNLEALIKSGIGYGYYMVHQLSKSKIINKKVTEEYRNKASKVEKVVVYYGGKSGTGARVDIVVTTPTYELKFNFRNKQGGKYVSHLMCEYKYR